MNPRRLQKELGHRGPRTFSLKVLNTQWCLLKVDQTFPKHTHTHTLPLCAGRWCLCNKWTGVALWLRQETSSWKQKHSQQTSSNVPVLLITVNALWWSPQSEVLLDRSATEPSLGSWNEFLMSPLRLSFLLNFVLFFPRAVFQSGPWTLEERRFRERGSVGTQRSAEWEQRDQRRMLARRQGWWEALTGTSHDMFVDSVTLLTKCSLKSAGSYLFACADVNGLFTLQGRSSFLYKALV